MGGENELTKVLLLCPSCQFYLLLTAFCEFLSYFPFIHAHSKPLMSSQTPKVTGQISPSIAGGPKGSAQGGCSVNIINQL